ncbi:hypothetical protein SLE2022_223180 [Rubroshorea leprosula]
MAMAAPTTTTRLKLPGVALNSKRSTFLGGGVQQLSPNVGRPSQSSPSLLLNVEAKARTKRERRQARHSRIRKKVGTPERPRLCVFLSNKHLHVQVIDDTKMHTLASASTMQKPMSEEFNYTSGPTVEVAKRIGEIIAKTCLEKGITTVVFDSGGFPYHGRVEAVADSVREHGLQF